MVSFSFPILSFTHERHKFHLESCVQLNAWHYHKRSTHAPVRPHAAVLMAHKTHLRFTVCRSVYLLAALRFKCKNNNLLMRRRRHASYLSSIAFHPFTSLSAISCDRILLPPQPPPTYFARLLMDFLFLFSAFYDSMEIHMQMGQLQLHDARARTLTTEYLTLLSDFANRRTETQMDHFSWANNAIRK